MLRMKGNVGAKNALLPIGAWLGLKRVLLGGGGVSSVRAPKGGEGGDVEGMER